MSSKRGIMMVEIGIGTVLFAMMVVPAFGVLTSGAKGSAQSLNATRAMQVARTALDAADTIDHDQLTDATLAALVDRIAVPEGVARPQLDPLEALENPRGKIITVRVAWRRAEGNQDRGEVVLRGLSLVAH